MKKLTILITASALVLSSVSLSGCRVATAGLKKGDERNFARSLNDVNASRAIKARMKRVEGFDLGGVDVEVAEGIVLLSGNVNRQEDRIEAERIAWSGPRVVQVGNEITLKGSQGFVRNTKDGFLHQSVRARMIATKAVKARNYNIEVHDGIVYLLGVARSPNELALAAQVASTTKGTREVISYVRVSGDNTAQTAAGPGYRGNPTNIAQGGQGRASLPTYTPPNTPLAQDYSGQLSGQNLPPIPDAQSLPPALPYTGPQSSNLLDNDAIESGEPYYLDPQTGERVEIPEGVTPIPYVPDTPGSLGAGAGPLPPGAKPSRVLGQGAVASLPSDDALGRFRTGTPGEAVSVIESAPYTLDPATGKMVPVTFVKGQWVRIYK